MLVKKGRIEASVILIATHGYAAAVELRAQGIKHGEREQSPPNSSAGGVQRHLQRSGAGKRVCCIANIAFQGGFRSEINFLPLLMKRLTLSASTLRAQSSEQKAAIAKALRERVWPLLGRGELKPVIDSVYPFAAVAEAHQRMESGAHIGKIVLDLTAD